MYIVLYVFIDFCKIYVFYCVDSKIDLKPRPYWRYQKMDWTIESGIQKYSDPQILRFSALIFGGFRPDLRSNIITNNKK